MSTKQGTMLNVTLSGDMISSAVQSIKMSKRFTKAVVKASILNILYQRMVLNQADLKTRKLEDTTFVVFRSRKAKDPLLRQYLVWMEGIVDAIEKNYLKEVFVFMKNPIDDDLIETYRFHLKYNMDENKEKLYSSSGLKHATAELFEFINHIGKNKKLNENTEIQVELTYWDSTPKVYEPPGFEASIGKYCLTAASKCDTHIGTLKTGFHKISCYGGGNVFKEMAATVISEMSVQEIEDDNEVDEHINIEEEINKSKSSKANNTTGSKLNMSNITVSDANCSVISESIDVEKYSFSCICGLSIPPDVDVIQCLLCKKRYHAPCHGFLNKEEALQLEFSCVECTSKDVKLHGIAPTERALFCRLRLILYFMEKNGNLPSDILKTIPEEHRNIIHEKLDSLDVFIGKYKRINLMSVRRLMRTFFVQDDSQML